MSNDVLLINLIIKINELKEAEYDSPEDVDISYIISFSDFLNTNFSKEMMSDDILSKINSIDTDIFTNEKYLYEFYKNNPIRLIIVQYKNEHKDIKSRLLFDKNTILKYLDKSYELIKYVDLKKEDVCDYIKVNEKVLYLLSKDFIDKNILLESLKINKKVALILDEDNKENYYPMRNYYLKNKRTDFLNDKEIYDIYIDDIIELLKEDISIYISLSDLSKNNNRVIEAVRKIDDRYISFSNKRS